MRPHTVRKWPGQRLREVSTLRAILVLAWSGLLGSSAAWSAQSAPAPSTDTSYPTAATATPMGPRLLNNQQLFVLLDKVQNILAQKNLPRDGTATPDQLADELTMVEIALANAADKTSEAAQAGYIMHASMEALCGRLNQSEIELRMVLQHGSAQGRLAAYKELAEVLLQAGKATALDDLATRGEQEKIPEELSSHIRMFANYLHIQGFPSFTIADTAGAMHTLGDYQGRVLVLDFWATWCQPYMNGLPTLMKTYQHFHPLGVDILGVCLDENMQNLVEVVKMGNISWPQALEPRQFNSPLLTKYGVWGVPANFVIGADGTLIAKNIHGDHLDQLLAKLLKQP